MLDSIFLPFILILYFSVQNCLDKGFIGIFFGISNQTIKKLIIGKIKTKRKSKIGIFIL